MFLCFKANLGLKGIWLGLSSAILTLSVIVVVTIIKTDWLKFVRMARERLESIDIV